MAERGAAHKYPEEPDSLEGVYRRLKRGWDLAALRRKGARVCRGQVAGDKW